jgi:predicted nucleic acid-binding protein
VILVDTSIWVDHLRAGNMMLAELLEAGRVLTHPFVIGELALGALRQRVAVMTALLDLPSAIVATEAEVLAFIDRHALFGRGIGYVDAHLLAAARLTAGTEVWTNDRKLHRVAEDLGMVLGRRREP